MMCCKWYDPQLDCSTPVKEIKSQLNVARSVNCWEGNSTTVCPRGPPYWCHLHQRLVRDSSYSIHVSSLPEVPGKLRSTAEKHDSSVAPKACLEAFGKWRKKPGNQDQGWMLSWASEVGRFNPWCWSPVTNPGRKHPKTTNWDTLASLIHHL